MAGPAEIQTRRAKCATLRRMVDRAKLLSLLICIGAVHAQPDHVEHVEHGPAEHVPIEIDTALEWQAVLDRAVESYPRFVELEARAREADALTRRSRSLFAGRPTLMLGYRSDDPLDDFGLAEYDVALGLPLWRFGERRAAGRTGASAVGEAEAAVAALRWEVAGLLQQILWDIEHAANELEVAADSVAIAEDIERVARRRHAVGDLPLEDTLLAEGVVLERRAALLEREAGLVDAEFAYELLTGLRTRPPARAEPLVEPYVISESHPLLSLAAATAERARAELALVARGAKGSPQLTIGPRRQRDPMTDFYTDSVGVEVAVPIGGRAHVAGEVAAAQRRVAEAQAERAAVERQLHAELHEALHRLRTAERALELAARRADIAARHREMGRVAFEQGEIDLVELLRRDETALLAARQARELDVRRGRAISAVNHALGKLQ